MLSLDGSSLRLRIRDDGRGFDVGANGGGTGLVGMRERMHAVGGKVDVASSATDGTELMVSCPVPGVPA
jgi:signal transduction histidine kinase